jgi:membrane associated rhomboid family serine protease
MNPFVLLLIIVTGITTYRGLSNEAIQRKYMFDARAVRVRKQRYRVLTAGFLHAHWPHFALNMWSLYSFGSALTEKIGAFGFLFTYIGSIIGGSLLSLSLNRKGDSLSVGASGGVCGVVFAAIFLIPGSFVMLPFIPIPISALWFAIGFLIISFVGFATKFDQIAHDAHAGGAFVGLLISILLRPQSLMTNGTQYIIVIAVFGLLLYVIHRYPHVLNLKSHFSEGTGRAGTPVRFDVKYFQTRLIRVGRWFERQVNWLLSTYRKKIEPKVDKLWQRWFG